MTRPGGRGRWAVGVGNICSNTGFTTRLRAGPPGQPASRPPLRCRIGQRTDTLHARRAWLPPLRRGRRPLPGRCRAPARPGSLSAGDGLRPGADALLALRAVGCRVGPSQPPRPARRSSSSASGQHLGNAVCRVDACRALLVRAHRTRRGGRPPHLLACPPRRRNSPAADGPLPDRAQPLHPLHGAGAGRHTRRELGPARPRAEEVAASLSGPFASCSLPRCTP
jgi:hypothetical protein